MCTQTQGVKADIAESLVKQDTDPYTILPKAKYTSVLRVGCTGKL